MTGVSVQNRFALVWSFLGQFTTIFKTCRLSLIERHVLLLLLNSAATLIYCITKAALKHTGVTLLHIACARADVQVRVARVDGSAILSYYGCLNHRIYPRRWRGRTVLSEICQLRLKAWRVDNTKALRYNMTGRHTNHATGS